MKKTAAALDTRVCLLDHGVATAAARARQERDRG